MKKITKSYLFIFVAIVAGILSGMANLPLFMKGAETVSSLFMNFLKLITGPIVFLSIFSTLLKMRGLDEMKTLGRKVIGYTILTTLIATFVALILFVVVDPLNTSLQSSDGVAPAAHSKSYLSFLVNIVPSNLVHAFLHNHVIAIAFMAFLGGIAALKLPEETRQPLNAFFSSLFQLVLKITELVIVLMPFGIWAFTTLLVEDLRHNFSHFSSLLLYLSCVVGAVLIQGLVVLPLMLKLKGISPLKTAKGAMEALLLAFFSKSSNATLPITMKCAQSKLNIAPRVAQFSLPLCTVINMNGCALFIFTTVLFVGGVHHHTFTLVDMGLWMVLATIAAIGNAGVPMGCFFLSSAFLIAIDVPITTMGLILPFYAFLDMIETALNVWSDICVTAMVDRDLMVKSEILARQ